MLMCLCINAEVYISTTRMCTSVLGLYKINRVVNNGQNLNEPSIDIEMRDIFTQLTSCVGLCLGNFQRN